jgi:hypothetical protein
LITATGSALPLELAASAQADTATIAARAIHLRSGRKSITVLLIYRPYGAESECDLARGAPPGRIG